MYAQISSFTKQYTPQLQQRAGFFSSKAWLLLLITLSGTGLAKATEAAAAYEMRAALPQLPGIVIEASEQWEVIKLSENVLGLHTLTGRNESGNPTASSAVTEEISKHTWSEATPADVQVPSGKPANAMATNSASGSPRAARTNQNLMGIVMEADTRSPIPGATVQIEGQQTGVTTDADGKFTIPSLNPGSYTLIIRHLGYSERKITLQHPKESPVEVLMTSSVVEADDLIVTASPLGRNIQYQPVESLNAEALQMKAAPSLGEILEGHPGITTRSYGSASARPVIRGFDGDRVLVMQNGERMGDLSGTAVDHAVALDPLSMDRVEVVRGPASLLYGSGAIGGVVNMFTYDMPREWGYGTRTSVASHLSSVNRMGAGTLSVRHGGENLAASARMIYRKGGDLQTPEGKLPDTAIDNLSYGGGLGYRDGPFESGLAVTGMNYIYGLPEAVDNPEESIEIRMKRTNIQSISTLKMDGFFDHAELRLHYSDYFHKEIEINQLGSDSVQEDLEISFDQQTLSSSLLLRHRALGPLKGALGLSVNRSEIEVGGNEALTPNATGYFLAGYLYEELSLGKHFSLKSGVRLEQKGTEVKPNELFTDEDEFRDRNDLIFSGAVGLNYTSGSIWTAGIQVARAFRTPTIEELYSYAPHAAAGSFDIGDPSLKNEVSLGADAFVEFRTSRIDGELSLFSNQISNYIDFYPTGRIHEASGLPVFEYGSKDARFYGFEVKMDAALSPLFQAGAGFDYVRATEISGDKNDLPFIPPFRSHLHLTADSGLWWAGGRVQIVNSQNRVAPNEQSTEGYTLLGADAGYRFKGGATLALRIDNLLNKGYRDHLSRVENRNAPMPGRNVNLMFRWEF